MAYASLRALEEARGDLNNGTDDVALIDAEWILQWKKPLPCRQQLPDEAMFKGSVDSGPVVILAVSYPWLTKMHPDPERWHLKIIQHYLHLYFTLENRGFDQRKGEASLRDPTGRGKRVAIFWDWLSLFQEHNPGGARTEEQLASFNRALKNINLWYGNSETMVWRLTKLPPAPNPGHFACGPRRS